MNKKLSKDEKYMKMCLTLARKGWGKVAPNPMVGCVVLDKKGNLVSKGYHKKCGKNHAERDALSKLKNNEAEGGTLYVNLEPCSHWGKTPPCTDIIIEKKIARVVYAMKDPNPAINGISKLKRAGITVIGGVLEEEALFLNRVFIKNITKNLPYVVLKTAVTMDGKIATKSGDSKWITSEKSRAEVYKMRKCFDCILTSSNTVIADNPKMDMPKGKIKCILDRDSKINNSFEIMKPGNVYIANSQNTPLKNGMLDLNAVFHELYKKGVCTVFVECGGTLAGALLKENLVDEVYQFTAPKILNDNLGQSSFNGDVVSKISDCIKLKIYETKIIDSDVLLKAIVV